MQEQTWQAAYRHVFPAAELDRGGFIRAERWRDRIARPPAGWTTLVAERDGAIAGFASVGPSRDEPAVGELYAIYVEPAGVVDRDRTRVDRAGGGRAAHATSTRRRSGCSRTTRGHAAFYERAGWAPDGERKSEVRWGVRAQEVRYRKRAKRASDTVPVSDTFSSSSPVVLVRQQLAGVLERRPAHRVDLVLRARLVRARHAVVAHLLSAPAGPR